MLKISRSTSLSHLILQTGDKSPILFTTLILTMLFVVSGFTRTYAQAVFGSIVGTVTDPTGAVVPDATVVVTDVSKGTSQTVQSNGSGNYSVSRLIPDTYTVKATAKGFNPAQADNVVVSADSAPQVNLVFQTEGTQQSVTVTAAGPALQTDGADVSTVISERQFQDLPNQNRNFSTFALLVPGVQ